MTNLDKPVSRLVTIADQETEVTLSPEEGGQLIFREKGKRGEKNRKRLSLAELLDQHEDSLFAVGQAEAPPALGKAGVDLIDLGSLEPLIMIEGEDFSPAVKGKLWSLVRELRNRRREEAGLPAVEAR